MTTQLNTLYDHEAQIGMVPPFGSARPAGTAAASLRPVCESGHWFDICCSSFQLQPRGGATRNFRLRNEKGGSRYYKAPANGSGSSPRGLVHAACTSPVRAGAAPSHAAMDVRWNEGIGHEADGPGMDFDVIAAGFKFSGVGAAEDVNNDGTTATVTTIDSSERKMSLTPSGTTPAGASTPTAPAGAPNFTESTNQSTESEEAEDMLAEMLRSLAQDDTLCTTLPVAGDHIVIPPLVDAAAKPGGGGDGGTNPPPPGVPPLVDTSSEPANSVRPPPLTHIDAMVSPFGGATPGSGFAGGEGSTGSGYAARTAFSPSQEQQQQQQQQQQQHPPRQLHGVLEGAAMLPRPSPSPIIAPPAPAPTPTIVPPGRHGPAGGYVGGTGIHGFPGTGSPARREYGSSGGGGGGGERVTKESVLMAMHRELLVDLHESSAQLTDAYPRCVGLPRHWSELARLKLEHQHLAAENSTLRGHTTRRAHQQHGGWGNAPASHHPAMGGYGHNAHGHAGGHGRGNPKSPGRGLGHAHHADGIGHYGHAVASPHHHDDAGPGPGPAACIGNVPAVMPEKVESQIDKVKLKTKLCKYYMMTNSEDNCPFFGRHGWCAFAHGEEELMTPYGGATSPIGGQMVGRRQDTRGGGGQGFTADGIGGY